MNESNSEGCWIENKVRFMHTGKYPSGLPSQKRRFYRLQNNDYMLIEGILFKRNFSSVLLWCVTIEQEKKILNTYHNNPTGGNLSAKTTSIKIMCTGYFWPTLFNDSYSLVKACKEFQFFVGRRKNSTIPLNPIVVDKPFMQWGLDFIEMINPTSSIGHK